MRTVASSAPIFSASRSHRAMRSINSSRLRDWDASVPAQTASNSTRQSACSGATLGAGTPVADGASAPAGTTVPGDTTAGSGATVGADARAGSWARAAAPTHRASGRPAAPKRAAALEKFLLIVPPSPFHRETGSLYAGAVFMPVWQRAQSGNGKATVPWQTPQNCPSMIVDILSPSVNFFLMLKM